MNVTFVSFFVQLVIHSPTNRGGINVVTAQIYCLRRFRQGGEGTLNRLRLLINRLNQPH